MRHLAMNSDPTNHPERPSFKDHFSTHSATYASSRPGYPDSLFTYLSSLCDQHERAWDCATGSGQAAIKLADYFKRVIATDASAAQIAHAQPHQTVSYVVTRAENSTLENNSVDLISVAQALHWFDLPAFTAEVDRILKSSGILAVWSYNLLTINPALDERIQHLYGDVLKPYWPAERQLVEEGYRSIDFPYPELSSPPFAMELDWTLAQLRDYLSTWSAVKACLAATGLDPLERITEQLLERWGDTQASKRIRWALSIRAWKKQ